MSHKLLRWKVIGKASLDAGIVDDNSQELDVTLNSWKSDLDTGVHKRAIQGLLEAGMSVSRVIKKVMGYSGGNYQKGLAVIGTA